jgi:predicted dehydrogenase
MIEKPAGLNAAEIVALERQAKAADRVASVLYPRRLHPCMIAARQWVAGGGIGSLLTMEGRFLATQVRFRDPASWLFRRPLAGGGILLWLGCHMLDLLHHVSGDEIVEVGARFAIRSGEQIEVEDCAALSLRFASGTIGTFHAGYTLAFSGSGYLNRTGYDSYLGFNGRAGRVVWPDLNAKLYVESAPATPGAPAGREETFTLPESSAYGGTFGETFLRQFIAATQRRGEPPTRLADALRTARVIEAAEESARTGRFVRVAT